MVRAGRAGLFPVLPVVVRVHQQAFEGLSGFFWGVGLTVWNVLMREAGLILRSFFPRACPQTVGDGPSAGGVDPEGMARHLMAAIWLNVRRAPGYAWRSRGRSLPVSIGLVLSELAFLPAAVGFDTWRILRDEPTSSRFVSMRGAPRVGAPFDTGSYQSRVEQADRAAPRRTLGSCWRAARAGVRSRDPQAVTDAAATGLRQLERLERECGGVLFSMTPHLLEESGGLAAVAGMEDARRQGRTQEATTPSRLALALVCVPLPGLLLGPAFDRAAQRSHSRGVGITHNDVPSIPFKSPLFGSVSPLQT